MISLQQTAAAAAKETMDVEILSGLFFYSAAAVADAMVPALAEAVAVMETTAVEASSGLSFYSAAAVAETMVVLSANTRY